jgi:hypothetical protein
MLHRVALLVAVLAAGAAFPREVQAAGMFVTPHGARPLGRGGAFVAGADDLNAIYYNPAGVAAIDFGDTGWSGLLTPGSSCRTSPTRAMKTASCGRR